MWDNRCVRAHATSLVVLVLAAGGAGSAGAAPRDALAASRACSELAALRAVFPQPAAVAYERRSLVRRQGARQPFVNRKCGGWWTTYTGFRGTQAYADVSITLYKSRRDALIGLAEPIAGPVQTFPGGVRMRTRVRRLATDSGVTSIVGNVLVNSTGAGPHNGVYSGRVAVRAWIRIHRRIHAAVLTSTRRQRTRGQIFH